MSVEQERTILREVLGSIPQGVDCASYLAGAAEALLLLRGEGSATVAQQQQPQDREVFPRGPSLAEEIGPSARCRRIRWAQDRARRHGWAGMAGAVEEEFLVSLRTAKRDVKAAKAAARRSSHRQGEMW